MALRKVLGVLALLIASMFGVASANAKVFYISGSSRSTSGGTSCSNALSVAWFNNSASWGTASHQISAGTTVYLCGVFTGTPGEVLLTVRGSGTASEPIIIKFMTGAVLTAPYWSGNGAIQMNNVSHVIVDGGTNGIIQNTANGTGRAYRQNSVAVHAANCTSCTVQHLTMQNLYVRTSSTDYGATHSNNCVYWHGSNYMTVNYVTCHDASWAMAGDGNNFTLENSNIYHVDHGVASGPAGVASGYSIHNNHFHDFANWDSPANTYHHDAIHLWGQNGGKVTGGSIYNNTFDGDFGVNVTGHIYLQQSISNVSVYNNVFSTPSTRTIVALWFAGSSSAPGSNNSAYNNSINAGGHRTGSAMFVAYQTNFTGLNNILAGGQSNITILGGTRSSSGINNNVYRDLLADFGDPNGFWINSSHYYSLSAWRSACHCDGVSKILTGAQSTSFSAVTGPEGTSMTDGAQVSDSVNLDVVNAETTTDPELAPLQAVAEGSGINLSDIATEDLAALAFNKDGAPRPTAGPWNAGPF